MLPGWPTFEKALLTLDTEWALIKKVDQLQPDNSNYYFGVKTVGERSGNGFTTTRPTLPILNTTRCTTPRVARKLLGASIHSGWGVIYPRKKQAWLDDGVDMFKCELSIDREYGKERTTRS